MIKLNYYVNKNYYWSFSDTTPAWVLIMLINQFSCNLFVIICMMEEAKCIYGNGGFIYKYIYIFRPVFNVIFPDINPCGWNHVWRRLLKSEVKLRVSCYLLDYCYYYTLNSSFSDWLKAYSEFSKSAPVTLSSCRLYNNHVKDTQSHRWSFHVWLRCMIFKGNHVKFACFCVACR